MAEWEAYSELEPFGSGYDDLRVGLVCSTIANFFTWAHSKSDKRWFPRDFVTDHLALPKKKKTAKEKAQELAQRIKETFTTLDTKG